MQKRKLKKTKCCTHTAQQMLVLCKTAKFNNNFPLDSFGKELIINQNFAHLFDNDQI